MDPDANHEIVHNDSISVSRPTPEESQESARLLKPCALVAVNSNWSLQRDPAARIEWRLPNQYLVVAADSVIEDADWRGADSSYISLNLHDAESVISRRLRLQRIHGKERWRKRKGFADVVFGISIRKVEIHWYEASGIGPREFKIKRFVD